MGRIAKLWVFIALLGGFGMRVALASPPGTHRGSAHVAAAARAPLDLRPSANALTAAETAPPTFPSSLHRHSLGNQDEPQLPPMGAGTRQERIPSRAEEFARRVHREGLPVARLWENKSALLSLGLNTKGKPGLWVMQKIR
jgi:hypothetical protein